MKESNTQKELSRVPRTLSESSNTKVLEVLFDAGGTVMSDIIIYVASSQMKDLFGDCWFSINDLCEVMGYERTKSQRKLTEKQLDFLFSNQRPVYITEQNGQKIEHPIENTFEAALYRLGTSNLSVAYAMNGKTQYKFIQILDRFEIKDNFGKTNLAALVIPAGDYESESKLINRLSNYEEVDSVMGLANIEAMDGYVLTDKLTPRQFSELVGLDYEVAKVLYAAYAINDEDYGDVVNGLESYSVPLIDMFMFAYDEVDKGYVTLDDDLMDTLEDLHTQLNKAKLQLQSDDYSRILVYLNLPEEGTQTFDFLGTIHDEAYKFYPSDNVYIVGNSTSDYDLSSSFVNDNLIISILSALFVIIILLFTFNSAGLPVLLIAVIQGSIWMNFSFPYFEDSPLFFLSYLIVNSIQMGANIDYAIVISSRYMELKQQMPIKQAITETLNQAFPTIITSGAILAAAGALIGVLSSNGTISSIGVCLGRGTLISIVLVMGVLPQILLLGDTIIEKTSFTIKKRERTQVSSGKIAVTGLVHGYVNGRIDAIVNGIIIGDVDARIESKNVDGLTDGEEDNSQGEREEITDGSN